VQLWNSHWTASIYGPNTGSAFDLYYGRSFSANKSTANRVVLVRDTQ